MTIRATAPTQEEFLRDHLTPGAPLVVRDALGWPAQPPWAFEDLVDRVGSQRVPLYDNLFTLVGVSTFRDYFDRYLTSDQHEHPPYLRWFARQSDQRLPWSDGAFEALADKWHAPQWLPEDGYVFPARPGPIDVTRDEFPAKGIFVCGRGSMTSWHVDPWHSDAYLCQVTGTKRIVLFEPGTTAPKDRDELFTVMDRPGKLPPSWPQHPLVDVVLEPGDCIFIPQDHPHAAAALAPSLSLTWNFVHQTHAEKHLDMVANGEVEDPAFRYFTKLVEAPRV